MGFSQTKQLPVQALSQDKNRLETLEKNKLRVKNEPDNAKAHYFLGLSYHIDLCMYEEAIKHYEDALSLKINYIEAYCSLGILYIEIGELSRAAIMFRESLALEKDYVDSV